MLSYYSINDCPVKYEWKCFTLEFRVLFELQLFSEASYKLLSSYTHACAFHIDTTTLADATYELVPEAEGGPGEAQVNFADAVENPNPTPEASN